jgi:hypothetical protein
MKLYFSNLTVLLQALLVSLPDEYQKGVSSFTIQMPTHGLNQRSINTGWVPSLTNGLITPASEEVVGPLFAKKKKNKKKNFAKTSTKDDDTDITPSPTLSNDLPVETSNKTSDELNPEEASMSTENNETSIVAESDNGRDETPSAGTITDVLNTLLDDEENRVKANERDELDISAYKLYLQWVKEQESVKDQPQQVTSQDDDRLKEIVDEAKKKFSEEDKVQEDQMEAAKQAREKAEQMERMQVEELKKRFEEEDKIRAQQLEAAKEAMKKAEELKNVKTEELKKKFEDEMKAQQLSEEGSESSSFENEEPIPFPDLQEGYSSPRVDTSVKKQNQKGSGRSWTNASEQIRLSRASKESGNKFDASMNEETVVSGLSESDTADDGAAIFTEDNSYQLSDLSIADAKSKEITEADRLAVSKISEVSQRALLAARLKMESDEKARRASDDEMNKKSETTYETREEALLSAKLKLEEIRMQKPSQKSKLGSNITADEVLETQDSHGDVDEVLDSFVDGELGDLHISEAEDEHHDHEDIDVTESIAEKYGSVDAFLMSVNGNYGGDDDGESDDVDMTDTIIAKYGSLEAFFSSLESDESNTEETSPQKNKLLNEHDNYVNKGQASLVQSEVDDGSIADSVEIPEIISDDDHEQDDEYDMTGSIIVQRHVYRLSPTEGTVKSSFSIEDRQYFKVKQDSTLEAYGNRSFILRQSSKKQSVFDFELGSIALVINGLKEDTDMEDASRNLAWLNAYAATLYCIANPLILHGQGLQISSGSGLAGILSILGSGHSDQSGSDSETSSSEENVSRTPKNLSKILMTDANESNILKCIDNLRVGMFPSNKVELGLLDPSEEVSPNLFRAFDFVLGFDCANDPYTVARIFASVLKEGSNHRFVHITFSEKEQRKLKNAVDSRLRIYSKVDDIVMDKLVLTPLVFNTQEEADLEINNVESSFWNEDVEVKEAETLLFTALTGYQDVEVTQERSQGHFVDNDTW